MRFLVVETGEGAAVVRRKIHSHRLGQLRALPASRRRTLGLSLVQAYVRHGERQLVGTNGALSSRIYDAHAAAGMAQIYKERLVRLYCPIAVDRYRDLLLRFTGANATAPYVCR